MLKVELTGEGTIDNAVIYLEDPIEKIPYFLDPKTSKKWQKDDISIPIDGELNYSLYVLALSGTKFKCVITNKVDNKTISFEGVTGKKIKSIAHEISSADFK